MINQNLQMEVIIKQIVPTQFLNICLNILYVTLYLNRFEPNQLQWDPITITFGWIEIDFSLESVAISLLMLRLFKNQNRHKNIKTKTRTQKYKNTKTAKTISLPISFTTWLMNFWNENESIRKWQMWQSLILLHPVIEFQLFLKL